ncbi:MAG: tetraacyldisaccharide 4'-kinase [bacterium]
MRSKVEQTLNRIWYGDKKPGAFLGFLEHLYSFAFRLNRRVAGYREAKDLRDKPIIVVGNLTAGGAGKTPLVIKLCELGKANGLRVGVVSRGYGRRSTGAIRVSADTNPRDVGDEPFLISARCSVPVEVDVNRENAVRKLLSEVDIIISDDGLQRRQLPRVLEVCVTDQQRGFGNGRLLPAGPLREPASRLESVDFVIEHQRRGRGSMMPDGHSMRLEPGKITELHGDRTISFEEIRSSDTKIHAFAGIARPERFFEMLEQAGIKCETRPFPDHHRYQNSDFSEVAAGQMILMTEKDAVKCRRLPLTNAWYIPVDAVLTERLENELVHKLKYVGRRAKFRSSGIKP